MTVPLYCTRDIASRVIDSMVSRPAFTANQGQSPVSNIMGRGVATHQMCFPIGRSLCVPNYAYSYASANVNGLGQRPAFGGSVVGSGVGNR